MRSRKKVLLVWWYDRRDLIAPYIEMQDEIEFTVLFYRFPHQENKEVAESLPFRRIFWLDYLSPYQLLKDVQPEKIIFLGNESMLNISLIVAANIMSIKTCYVSHGLRSELSEIINKIDNTDESQVKAERYSKKSKNFTNKKWHTLVFLLFTFSLRKPKVLFLQIRLLQSFYNTQNHYKSLATIQNPLRKVNSYYVFAPQNASMLHELDEPKESSIYYTGPYLMDTLFKVLRNSTSNSNYWLMIDQPIVSLTTDQKWNLYDKIAQQAKRFGKLLVIKLHPMEYDSTLPELENIEWKKHVESLPKLIKDANGIIGFYSALLLPAITFKKCIIFDTDSKGIVAKWKELKVAKFLELENFKWTDVSFDDFEITNKNRQAFIEQFVVYIDGEGTRRLKELIVSNDA